MNTPVLTEAQQKRSLSAKKKSKKLTIRNILASPFTSYWPLVKPEDAVMLTDTLKEYLVKIKPPKVKVPWNELKNIPREKRKDFRSKCSQTEFETMDKNYRSNIVFGANETTKLLEKSAVSSILISHHVDPKFMVKHILDMAVLRNTPILIVPNLSSLLKEQAGIASIAVAFRENSSIGANYLAIDQKIKEIALDYPPPASHINFYRKSLHIEDESLNMSAVKDSRMDVSESSCDNTVRPTRNLYLRRKSKSERAFVPQASKQQESVNLINKMDVDSSGFMAFGDAEPVVKDYSGADQKAKAKSKVSYKSLIIKRVTSNKDREQKKIETLKRKR